MALMTDRRIPRARACLAVCAAWLAAILLASPVALACGDAAQSWAAACSASEGVRTEVEECLPGRVMVVATSPGGAPLRVELQRDAKHGFAHAGPYAVSPVGEFADWSAEPATTRRAFDAVLACAARGLPDAAVPPPPAQVPWVLAGAVAAFVALCAARLRRPSRRALATAAGLVALTAITWVARRSAFPASFFHQNGQGPLWVGFAMGTPTAYGPGYREIFGRVVDSASDPDLALIAVQSAAAALVPAFAWTIARASGGSRLVAWAIAVAIALDPVSARAARSESYYATVGTLLFASAAALALGTRAPRLRSLTWVIGSVSAGLFAAEAARVHPVGWIAAGLIPIGALAARGRARRRLPVGLAAGVVFAATLAVAAGPAILDVMRGPLGSKYGVGLDGNALQMLRGAVLGAGGVLAVLAMLSWRARGGRVPRALVVFAIVVAAVVANHIGPVTPWIFRAYLLVYVPAVAGGIAVLLTLPLSTPARRAAVAAAALAACLVADFAGVHRLTTRTTDEDEAAFVMRWRATLPQGAVVSYLAGVDLRRVFLALYEGGARNLHPHRVVAEEPLHTLHAGDLPSYWYASSLCATPKGRAFCEDVARHFPLEEVESADLVSQGSLPDLVYDEPRVRVVLYRVGDPHGGGH